MSNAIISLPEFTKCRDKFFSNVKEHGGCNGKPLHYFRPQIISGEHCKHPEVGEFAQVSST